MGYSYSYSSISSTTGDNAKIRNSFFYLTYFIKLSVAKSFHILYTYSRSDI